MADQIRVNENIHSWGSITLKAAGRKYVGFTAVGYSHKRTRTKAYGMGRHHAPRARSRGKYEPGPGKLKGPKSTIEALRADLAAQSADGRSYGDVEFEVTISYTEADETPITVVLERCVIVSEDSNDEEGPDPLEEEIELDVMAIRKNGRYLFDASRGRP